MSDNPEPSGGLIGVAAVGMAACCGLPLLLGAGIALSTVGVAAGAVVLMALGVGLAAWGWRRRAADACCETPSSTGPPGAPRLGAGRAGATHPDPRRPGP